eukprot:3779077-Amphidinium_carterae.1
MDEVSWHAWQNHRSLPFLEVENEENSFAQFGQCWQGGDADDEDDAGTSTHRSVSTILSNIMDDEYIDYETDYSDHEEE